MTYVVTGRCVDCRYTDCCAVCPVDCFYEIVEPKMLVIDPDTCIDCQACVPACPINAIYEEDELPAEYLAWTEFNKNAFGNGTVINEQKDPLDGAADLETIQEREKANGWDITEPSAA